MVPSSLGLFILQFTKFVHYIREKGPAQFETLQYETPPVKRKFNLSSHTCIAKGRPEVIVYWVKENCNYDREIWVMTWLLLLQRWWEQREVDKILFYDSQWKFQCTEKYDCEKPKFRCQRSKKTGLVFYLCLRLPTSTFT